jgi:hypothetical protein
VDRGFNAVVFHGYIITGFFLPFQANGISMLPGLWRRTFNPLHITFRMEGSCGLSYPGHSFNVNFVLADHKTFHT